MTSKKQSGWVRSSLVVAGISVVLVSMVITIRQTSNFKPVYAQSCSVSSTLVNSCHPWFGGFSFRTGSLTADIASFEARIGRQLDVVRSYFPLGNRPLNNENRTLINRANTIIFTNYKPAIPWSDAAGADASVNAQIDAAAESIMAVSPKKIMLSLDAEPEDDVSTGVSCTTLAAKNPSGSPADYRAMWQNVRSRFDAKGVSNVVWVMNYMGYSRWDCIVKEMYPGNDFVDWVMWDPYATNSETWDTSVGRFYDFLNNQSDGSHAFASKPWGLAEWGTWQTSQASVYQYYSDAKNALESNRFPKLKLYSVFDATGSLDSRLDYTSAGLSDPLEQSHFNSFAASAAFRDPVVVAPTPDPAPTPETSSAPAQNSQSRTANKAAALPLPSNSAKIGDSNISIGNSGTKTAVNPYNLKGTVVLQAQVDLKTTKKVEYLIDGMIIATVDRAPFTFALDSTTLANGAHVLQTKVYSIDGTMKHDEAPIYIDNRTGLGRLVPIEKNDRILLAAAAATPFVVIGLIGAAWLTGHRKWVLWVSKKLNISKAKSFISRAKF